jgi:uncharacterized caspase-like protein
MIDMMVYRHMQARLIVLLVSVVLALLAVPTTEIRAQSEPRVALIIGNAAYPDAESPVKDAVSHARALAEELKGLGFDVDVGENLTKEGTRSAMERFYGKIKPGSAALFFFSGFGIQSDRQTYVIPVNAQIWSEADVKRDGYSLDSVLAEMNSRGAKVKIAILDASRRNPFERRFRAVAAGLGPATAPRGTAIMYAAPPGSVIRDSERQLFMPELLKEIRRPGKIQEMFNRVLVAVSRESREQAPWFSSSLVDEFSFARGTAATTPPADADAEARTAYQSAERLGTRQGWEDFLRKHSSGRYADLARDQLAKLDARPTPAPTDDAQARRAYQSAERLGTRQGWEDFLRKHPSGRYADLARDQLAKLDARPTPAPADEAEARRAYQSAERLGTRQGWEDFLRKHPSGRYADLARDQLEKLKVASKPDPRRDDPAIVELDQRIERNRNDTAAYYKRGQLFAQHGDFASAVKDFDEVLRLNPRDPEALNNRCWARAIVGDLQQALKDCNEALHIRPRYLDAHDSRGFVNLKIGQPRNALADYDAALRINPKHASSLYGRGIAKLRTGNTASGNGDIAAAKAIQPDIAEEFASYGIR